MEDCRGSGTFEEEEWNFELDEVRLSWLEWAVMLNWEWKRKDAR